MKKSEQFLKWWQNVVKGNHISKSQMFKIALKLDNLKKSDYE